MAKLTFPDPSLAQEYTEAGITWTWNSTLEVWSTEGGDTVSSADQLTYNPNGTERTVDKRLEERVSVFDFGAKGDGVTNDTPAFQAAIDYCQDNNKVLYIPSYTYFLNKTANLTIDQGRYNSTPSGGMPVCAVVITKPIDIIATGAIFKVSIVFPGYHAFAFDNVKGGSFNGGMFEASDPSVSSAKALFKGAGVVMNHCDGTTVSNITCHNLKTSCQMYESIGCTIHDCLGYRDKEYISTEESVKIVSGTFFGGYSGKYNLIQNCQTYGGCNDGDIYFYGSGYGNRIDSCRAFFTELGDETYQILGKANQGLGLDAGQDSGQVTNCTAYGHYYGIESKGACGQTTLSNNLCVSNKICMTVRVGELGSDNPAAAVSGHVLIDSNTLLPRHGNGNTATSGDNEGNLGYQRMALEISKYASITVSNNYIGCEESPDATNGTTVDYDFAGIVAVNVSKAVNSQNPICLNITNNRFQFAQKYYGNFSYSRGAMISVINYWEDHLSKTYNADLSSVLCEGNIFTPKPDLIGGWQNDKEQFEPNNKPNFGKSPLPGSFYDRTDPDNPFLILDGNNNPTGGRVIYFEGCNSVVYSNNIHSMFGTAASRDLPYVQSTKVLNFIANGNRFVKQTRAFDHTYPDSSIINIEHQQTMSCIITNNAFGPGSIDTGGPEPCCRVNGNGPCVISNNSWFRCNRNAGSPNEGALIEYNFTASGTSIPLYCGLMATGNIMSIGQTYQSWYRVNGQQGVQQAYVCTDNNLINGVTTTS